MAENEEEYELVPLNPIRKIEKRIADLERTGITKGLDQELMDVMKTNQEVVDDLVKINSELTNKLSTVIASIEGLVKNLNNFIERVEVVGEEAPTEEVLEREKHLEDKITKLEKRINALILSKVPRRSWESVKAKRSPLQPPVRGPM